MKSKVIAVITAFVFVSGASVAFGASDAGAKLKDWYDKQFGITKANVEVQATDHLNSGFDGLGNKYDTLVTEGTDDLTNTGAEQAKESTGNIEKTAGEHIDSIKSKQIEIEKYMNSQFQQLKANAETGIKDAEDNFLKSKSTGHMRNLLNKAATDARAKLESDIKDTTAIALDDITEAINAAKIELQAQLDKKESATTDEIKTLIDNKVADLLESFIVFQESHVAGHKTIIEQTATKLENSAKNEMQDLVDGINK